MKDYDATEQAYKNGFKDGVEEVAEMLSKPPYIDFVAEWVIEDIKKKATEN